MNLFSNFKSRVGGGGFLTPKLLFNSKNDVWARFISQNFHSQFHQPRVGGKSSNPELEANPELLKDDLFILKPLFTTTTTSKPPPTSPPTTLPTILPVPTFFLPPPTDCNSGTFFLNQFGQFDFCFEWHQPNR